MDGNDDDSLSFLDSLTESVAPFIPWPHHQHAGGNITVSIRSWHSASTHTLVNLFTHLARILTFAVHEIFFCKDTTKQTSTEIDQ